ncbi:uncharacterized protein LOC129731883 [Wyeomyia smithii]|uniref:uncharacterized protein LOC129731883 n=1 Tax=Wyeomyia smithii TaxID=174621 RepID=UPI0024681DB2|nr:uncharacterized protein LOC129731883 [Wyeomyia smithii]
MKVFIALLVATLAIAAHASYVPAAWPVSSHGWNSWNGWNGWDNSWEDHSSHGWPAYEHSWPAASLYDNHGWNGWYGPKATLVQANVAKVAAPWGLPWGSYGYGHNKYQEAVPVAKYIAANPGAVHVAPLVGHTVNQKHIVA